MYEKAKLPKHPAIARQLIALSKVGGVQISEEIRNLATVDLFTAEDICKSSLNEVNVNLDLVQYIDDRQGRCIVLESHKKANYSLLSYVCLRDLFPLLITVSSKKYSKKWQLLVKEAFPNKTIAISTNELDKDIYIIHPNEVYSDELMKKIRFKQAIIDHIDSGSKRSNSTMLTIFSNLSIETYSVILLLNLRNLAVKGIDSATMLDKEVLEKLDLSAKGSLLVHFWQGVLYPHSTLLTILNTGYERIGDHIKSKGHKLTNKVSLLNALNICTVLVE